MNSSNTAPNTIPWPPLIYLSAAGVAVVLHRAVPLPWPSEPWGTVAFLAGLVLCGAAIVIEVSTALTFRKHKTTILPHRAASRLITSGPFAWSRNPIYLANTMLLIGAGLAFDVGWLVLTAPFAASLTYWLAIRREEAHLAATFGKDWHNYILQTHRWLGRRI